MVSVTGYQNAEETRPNKTRLRYIYIYTLYRQQLTLLISSNPVLTSLERITRCPRLSFMNNVAINHRHGFKKKNKKKDNK